MLQRMSKIFQNILSRGFRPGRTHAVDWVWRLTTGLDHSSGHGQKLTKNGDHKG